MATIFSLFNKVNIGGTPVITSGDRLIVNGSGLAYYNEITGFAEDIDLTSVVRTTGNQDISGQKNFNNALQIFDDPFVIIRNNDGSVFLSTEESRIKDFNGLDSVLLTNRHLSSSGGGVQLSWGDDGTNLYGVWNHTGVATSGSHIVNYSVVTGYSYPRGSNPSGYVTGSVVRPSDTGAFYPTTNPSGYIFSIPSDVVRTTGAQTVSGVKTFANDIRISGNIIDTGSVNSVDTNARKLKNSAGDDSIDWQNRYAYDDAGTLTLDWGDGGGYDGAGQPSFSWTSRTLSAYGAGLSLNWDSNYLANGGTVVLDWASLQLKDGSTATLDWNVKSLYGVWQHTGVASSSNHIVNYGVLTGYALPNSVVPIAKGGTASSGVAEAQTSLSVPGYSDEQTLTSNQMFQLAKNLGLHDPKIVTFREDFQGGATSSSTIGENGLVTYNQSGTMSIGVSQGTSNDFGRCQLRTASSTPTSGHGGALSVDYGNDNGNPFVAIDNPKWEIIYRAALEQTGSINCRIGLINSPNFSHTGTPNRGLYFRYNTNLGDTTWKRVSCVGGVETATDTNVTGSTDTLKMKIRMETASTALFSIYNSTGAVLSAETGISTAIAGSVAPRVSLYTHTGAQRGVFVDFIGYIATTNR